MYALMTRANKNVGDDLIHARGRRIVEHLAPDAPLVIANAARQLEASLTSSEIGQLQAIIVPGGPGVRAKLDAIYPFLPQAIARRIPVYFLGVGSRFFPGTLAPTQALIDPHSRELLRTLAQTAPIGVRDAVSARLLTACGVASQINGCPAWYSLPHLDQRPGLPPRIARIAFTTPADLSFIPQCLAVMRHVRTLFPSASVLVGFHHGIASDDAKMAKAHRELVAQSDKLGFECADLSGTSDKLVAYDACDLHIGYRVHAHIYFSSLRKPTVLLAEDSRGIGVLETLGGLGRPVWSRFASHALSRELLRVVKPDLLAARDAPIAKWLQTELEREVARGFPHVGVAADIIDRTFKTHMTPFVQSIFAAKT